MSNNIKALLAENEKLKEQLNLNRKQIESIPHDIDLLEFLKIPIALINHQFEIVFANRYFAEIINSEQSSFGGRHISELFRPEIYDEIIEKNLNLCLSGSNQVFNICKNINDDAQVIEFKCFLHKRKSSHQKDIVIYLERDNKLNHSYFQELNNSLKDAVFTVEFPERRIRYTNRATETLFAYSQEECIGRTTQFLHISEESFNRFGELLIEAIENGNDSLTIEYILKRKDGEQFPAEITSTFLKEGNEVKEVISIARDISIRKRTEEALLESEKLFRTIYENIPGGMVIINSENKIVNINGKALELTGYSKDELIGKYCDVLCPRGKNSSNCPIWSGMFEELQGIDTAIKCKDRNEHPILKTVKKVILNGQEHVLEIFQDNKERKEHLQALKETEKKQRSVLNNALEGILVLKDNRIIYSNPAIQNLTGYTAEEINSQNFLNAVYEEDKRVIIENNKKRLKGFNLPAYDFRVISKDGQIKWYLLNAKRIQWNGEDAILAFLQDINERKLAEQKLHNTLEELEFVTQNAPNVIWKAEIDQNIKFTNTYISDNVDLLLGLPRGTISNSWDKFFSHIKKEYLKDIPEIFALGVKNLGKDYSFTYEVIKNNGQTAWFQTTGRVIEKNGKLQTIGFTIDITDRKETQDALIESEENYKEIVEMSPDSIVTLNLAGKILTVNKGLLDLTGYCRGDYVGKYFWNVPIFMEESLKSFKEIFQSIVKGKKFSAIDFSWKHKNGEEKHGIARVKLIKRGILPVKIQAIVTDLTNQRKAQKLKNEVIIAKNSARLKQKFLANISHEMRTPMNGIIGMTEFLLDTELNPEQMDYVKTIKDSSESLLNIINEILNLSKLEQGKIEISEEKTDVYSLVETTVGLFRAQAFKKCIDLTFTIEKRFPRYLAIDKQSFRQILFNLLSNAIKYTEKGSVRLNVTSDKETDQYIFGTIEIEDTGIGIRAEDKKKIFEPFVRLDDGLTRKTEGTGLGLTITKSLVEKLGGEIDFKSKINKGSKFWFTFKARKLEKEDSVKNESSKLIPKKLKLNVLLAEDKALNQKVAGIMLKNLGCTYEIAENGLKAVKCFKEGKFDIILMDIMMPEMDGIEAMKTLKQKFSKVPPIIGLSAHALEGDAEHFIEMGMDDYLEKPINKEKLFLKLKTWGENPKFRNNDLA